MRGDWSRWLSKPPVLIAAGVTGAAALATGEFLDWRHAAWLQLHPLIANAIAVLVGSGTLIFVMGAGFALVSERPAHRASDPGSGKAATTQPRRRPRREQQPPDRTET